jgi:hypothetical protein
LKRLYITPNPIIPFPHGKKNVTALGFDRIEVPLPEKIMKEYEKRFDKT